MLNPLPTMLAALRRGLQESLYPEAQLWVTLQEGLFCLLYTHRVTKASTTVLRLISYCTPPTHLLSSNGS